MKWAIVCPSCHPVKRLTYISFMKQYLKVNLYTHMGVCAKSLQLCPTLCDPMDCSPPGSSMHGILQARILEWVVMPSSRGSSQPRDQTCVSYLAGGFFTDWATWEGGEAPHHCQRGKLVFWVCSLNYLSLLSISHALGAFCLLTKHTIKDLEYNCHLDFC